MLITWVGSKSVFESGYLEFFDSQMDPEKITILLHCNERTFLYFIFLANIRKSEKLSKKQPFET